MRIIVIGNGIVGHNLSAELNAIKPEVYDKYKNEENTATGGHYDLAFICVNTPYVSKENPCDITEVRNALNENDADIYVMKSTVLPGTCEKLENETGKAIVFSPEYYGSTHFSNNYSFDFTILGGEKKHCAKVQQALQNVYDGRHKFYITDHKTAELVKYMENSFLAMKVSFSIQFWEIANKAGVNYEILRELFLLDPRINPANTYVFDEHPYWKSHCYDKDIPAIAETYGAEFLLNMIDYNNGMKKKSRNE